MTDLAVQVDPAPIAVEVIEPREIPAERALWERAIYSLLSAALVLGFLYAHMNRYWVPAHPGVDQNGYLVGGKMLAANLSMRQQPQKPGSSQFDPHQFVGRMWVGADFGTAQERYYPKYPIGLPALVAAALWAGGYHLGPILAYWINPVAMTLAVLATYLLLRQLAAPFWALCGVVVFASSPVTMSLTTNPNSHATAVACATWGMYFLIRWWKRGGVWTATLAGLLLGYTCTIRYTEGLLLLPLLLVVIFVLASRWRERRAWLESTWAVLGWLIPIGLMVAFNYAAMGRITGYDGTNESIGFSLDNAADNWEATIRQLGSVALYCIFPFCLIGLAAMLWRTWRIGLVMAAWVLPCLVVYTCYYWAPDPPNLQQPGLNIGYMRFYLTIMPALVICAFWLFDHVCGLLTRPTAPHWALRAAQASFGAVVLIAVAVHVQSSAFACESDQLNRLMLQSNTRQVMADVPENSIIFAQDTNLLHHLQFVADYTIYTGETFNKWFIDNLPHLDPNEPQTWDPRRREALYSRLKDLNQQQLDEEARKLMLAALDTGRRVFFVIPRRDNDPPPNQHKANPAAANDARRLFPGGDLVRRFATDRFDFDVIAACNAPIVRPQTGDTNRALRRVVEQRVDRRSYSWQIVEIFKKPPAPPPPPPPRPAATRPTTRPAATRPAVSRPARAG